LLLVRFYPFIKNKMANAWPQKLHSREIGSSSLHTAALPTPHGGSLILNDQVSTRIGISV
jgi:hypothetical protein